MTALIFIGWVVLAFIGMELLSYALHRWVFHGVLWRIHETHHTHRAGLLEPNDAFAVFFTLIAIVLLAIGFFTDPVHGISFPVGLGMTIYGLLYFVVHDLVTHRRFMPLSTKIGWIDAVRRAHLRHHQDASKGGQEPFGLFLFPYREFHRTDRRIGRSELPGR